MAVGRDAIPVVLARRGEQTHDNADRCASTSHVASLPEEDRRVNKVYVSAARLSISIAIGMASC